MSWVEQMPGWFTSGYYAWCRALNRLQPSLRVGQFDLRVSPTTCKPLHREDLLVADLRPGTRLLDLGTGSGIIALAAAARGCDVVASDVSPAALADTAGNAVRNGVDDRIQALRSDCFVDVEGHFDVICSHLPYLEIDVGKDVDSQWAASANLAERVILGARAHLVDGGELRLLWPAEKSAKVHALAEQGGFAVTGEIPWKPRDHRMLLRRVLYFETGFDSTHYTLRPTGNGPGR